ncbi:hypothetical protein [Basfia succiniciproducens]|nr:hypothetical protein [Basfia succiniciproducens]
MSIKPQYVDKIFSGEKVYELRRRIFQKKVSTIVIYATSPVMKVIGEVNIDSIVIDSPENIFRRFEKSICITEDNFFNYFFNKNVAYAIKIGAVCKYSKPKELSYFGIDRAPQSYIYLK